MDWQDAKVKIRESQTRNGVYNTLEQFGVDIALPLNRSMRLARDHYRHKEAEVIQVALYRLTQIENKEV